jgi:hypothetical protein
MLTMPTSLDIDALTRHHLEAVIRTLGKRVVADVIEIGRRLTEAKRIAGHGGWLPWLEQEFGWREQTARNFIQVDECSLKSPNFGDLDISVAGLYLLAHPSTPEPVRHEVIQRAEVGEHGALRRNAYTWTDCKLMRPLGKPIGPPRR